MCYVNGWNFYLKSYILVLLNNDPYFYENNVILMENNCLFFSKILLATFGIFIFILRKTLVFALVRIPLPVKRASKKNLLTFKLKLAKRFCY